MNSRNLTFVVFSAPSARRRAASHLGAELKDARQQDSALAATATATKTDTAT